MPDLMHSFMSQANAKGARSTALHSLQWTIAILLAGLPVSMLSGAPKWLLICIVVGVGASLITFIFSYLFLLVRNPDALRSETFTLSKMAIEKGLTGDSIKGLSQDQKVGAIEHEDQPVTSDEGAKR